MLSEHLAEWLHSVVAPWLAPLDGGRCEEVLLWQSRAEDTVHSSDGVADAHGVPRVAVVASTNGDEVVSLPLPEGLLVLDRHLERYLDSHRTAVCIEDPIEAFGEHLQEFLT